MATVKKVKEGIFMILLTTNISQGTTTSRVDIKKILPDYRCNLLYKIENQQDFFLWLEIFEKSTGLAVFPEEIQTVSATRNGVQVKMKKCLFEDERSVWESSWTGPKLLNCVSCNKFSVSTESSFEVVIQLKSFSEDLTRTNKKLKSVQQAIQQIRQNHSLADVKFLCENQIITGHSTILSAGSPVLAAMFKKDFKEKQQIVVKITDITVDVFKQLLQYFYVQDADFQNVDVAELLVAADKYKVNSLKEQCAIHLSKNLTLENFAHRLALGHLHEIRYLVESSLNFMVKYAKEVCSLEKDCLEIIKNYPKLTLEIIKRMAAK